MGLSLGSVGLGWGYVEDTNDSQRNSRPRNGGDSHKGTPTSSALPTTHNCIVYNNLCLPSISISNRMKPCDILARCLLRNNNFIDLVLKSHYTIPGFQHHPLPMNEIQTKQERGHIVQLWWRDIGEMPGSNKKPFQDSWVFVRSSWKTVRKTN